MLITNSTDRYIRLSIFKDKSEDETYEAFAYIIAPSCSLNIDTQDHLVIGYDKE